MNLFDQLVTQAMQSASALGTVRPAVEKELLHHDILREMSHAGLLAGLVFIGGTCLRACHGSPRLSEDIDFTGGAGFDPARLTDLGAVLEKTLMEKYGLPISVSAPLREDGNVRTWKLRMQTRPADSRLPAQRIHIDICAVPSHQPRPALIRNSYGIDMGTDGLIIQAESREEICADKWVALAFRPNRIQYRDLWDLLWLERQGIQPDAALVFQKLEDRRQTRPAFLSALHGRIGELETDPNHPSEFRQEMERFLPATTIREAIQHPDFWSLLILSLREQESRFS
ncbi:MAG: nucleotidyl transferase AbiEii/AbiGii toxin family protein [Kiritimatiellales bacterium]|nr:nucleotidyl transferase AbiEii/AbiGii toxin family protein [Kiritimatiellales bacterium]